MFYLFPAHQPFYEPELNISLEKANWKFMKAFLSSTQQKAFYTSFWLNSVTGRFQGGSSTQSITIKTSYLYL